MAAEIDPGAYEAVVIRLLIPNATPNDLGTNVV